MRIEIRGCETDGPIVRGMIAPRDAPTVHLHPKVGHDGRHQRHANREERSEDGQRPIHAPIKT